MEARYTPCEKMKDLTGVKEARAPCLKCDNLCLQLCEDADHYPIYTANRQVRDGYNKVIFNCELQDYCP